MSTPIDTDAQKRAAGIAPASDGVSAALDAGLAARAVRLLPRNNGVAVLGDSRSAQATGSDGFRNNGFLSWLRFLTRQRIDIKYDTSFGAYTGLNYTTPVLVDPSNDNFGLSGDTTPQMLGRTDAMLAATTASTVILFASINDRVSTGALTADATIANLDQMIAKITTAGRVCILVAEMPTGDASNTGTGLGAVGSTQLAYHFRVRRWCLDQRRRPGVFVVDPWPLFADKASTSGYNQTGLTVDGRHPNIAGAMLLASTIAPVINYLYPPVSVMPASAADTYSATNNIYGPLNSNPMMVGTGGSLGTNCTGSLADGTQSSGGSGTTGATATYSKNADGSQRVVLSGTPTGSAGTASFALARSTSFNTKIAAGDVLEALADISVAAGSTGVTMLALQLILTNAGANVASMTDMGQHNAGVYLPTTAHAGVLRTPKLQVPAGATFDNAQVVLTAWLDPSVAANLTVDIASMVARKA